MYNQEIQALKRQRNIESFQPYPSYTSTPYDTSQLYQVYKENTFRAKQKYQSISFQQNKYKQKHKDENTYDKMRNLQKQNNSLKESLMIAQNCNKRYETKIHRLQNTIKQQQTLLEQCEKQIGNFSKNYRILLQNIGDKLKQQSYKQSIRNQSLSQNLVKSKQILHQQQNSSMNQDKISKQQDYKTFYEYLAQKILNQQKSILNHCKKLEQSNYSKESHHKNNITKTASKNIDIDNHKKTVKCIKKQNIQVDPHYGCLASKKSTHRLLKYKS